MAKFWSKDIRVYLGGYDISQSQVRLAVTMQSQALDPTSFPDAAERVLPGVRQDALEWAGIFDDQATGATADMYAAATAILGTATAGTLVSVLVGTGTGSVAFVGTALLLSKKIGSSINDLVRIGADFGVDGSWAVSKSLGTRDNYVNEQGSGSIDNGTLTTAGGTLYVHVFNTNNANGSVVLQHGTSTSTWTDVNSFLFTGRMATILSGAGTIQRWVRFKVNGLLTGSSADVQCVFTRA